MWDHAANTQRDREKLIQRHIHEQNGHWENYHSTLMREQRWRPKWMGETSSERRILPDHEPVSVPQSHNTRCPHDSHNRQRHVLSSYFHRRGRVCGPITECKRNEITTTEQTPISRNGHFWIPKPRTACRATTERSPWSYQPLLSPELQYYY